GGEQGSEVLQIMGVALALAVGGTGAAVVRQVGAFVKGDAQPKQIFYNAGLGARHIARGVGVFNAQDEASAPPANVIVSQEGCAQIAQVEVSGGAGGEAANGGGPG